MVKQNIHSILDGAEDMKKNNARNGDRSVWVWGQTIILNSMAVEEITRKETFY